MKPELLAPAGNMEKLKIAIHYGADAIYLAGTAFGLRNLADNFSAQELAEAVVYAHQRSVKVYLAVNAYPDNQDLPALQRYLEELAHIPFDACIAADPGVIDLLQSISPQRPIHLSTQANTTNWRSVRFWERQGISRVNLAREMPLEGIREVRQQTGMELEVFVHGAMCIAYSGRCLLSGVLSQRHANRGECAHPCRWSYALVEETRPGEYFPIMEDATGSFIFNSRDLCLLQYLPDLLNAGVTSLKIEGRMKGVNYVASVVRVYREALDRYLDDPDTYSCRSQWLDELGKISHRGYTTGFLFGAPRNLDHEFHSRYVRSHEFVGLVEEILPNGWAVVAVKNRVEAGQQLEFIGRTMSSDLLTLSSFHATADGSHPLQAANPNQRIFLPVPFPVAPLDLIRREKP